MAFTDVFKKGFSLKEKADLLEWEAERLNPELKNCEGTGSMFTMHWSFSAQKTLFEQMQWLLERDFFITNMTDHRSSSVSYRRFGYRFHGEALLKTDLFSKPMPYGVGVYHDNVNANKDANGDAVASWSDYDTWVSEKKPWLAVVSVEALLSRLSDTKEPSGQIFAIASALVSNDKFLKSPWCETPQEALLSVFKQVDVVIQKVKEASNVFNEFAESKKKKDSALAELNTLIDDMQPTKEKK